MCTTHITVGRPRLHQGVAGLDLVATGLFLADIQTPRRILK